MKLKNDFNTRFSLAILIGMLITVLALSIVKFQDPSTRIFLQCLISIGALAGVVNTVLSAQGSIWTYLFGFIDVFIASIVTLESSIGSPNPVWGQFILHAAYFLPMQFVGYFQWRKRGAGSENSVRARRLGPWGWVITVVGFAAGTVAVYLLLNVLGGGSASGPINTIVALDTIVVALSVLGQVLMSLAYMEQWIAWILVNVFAIILYALKSSASSADGYTVVYMIKYIFYFVNSINGLRIWIGLSRAERGEA